MITWSFMKYGVTNTVVSRVTIDKNYEQYISAAYVAAYVLLRNLYPYSRSVPRCSRYSDAVMVGILFRAHVPYISGELSSRRSAQALGIVNRFKTKSQFTNRDLARCRFLAYASERHRGSENLPSQPANYSQVSH